MSTAEIHTIDAAYMIEFELMPGGLHVKDLSGDTAPYTYTPPYSSYLYYYTEYGVWRRTTGNGKWKFASDEKGRNYRPVIIRECGIPEMKGKHCDKIIEDDMVDALAYSMKGSKTTAEEVKQATDWYKMMREGKKKVKDDLNEHIFSLPLVAAKRRRTGIITNITEGGNEMTKHLYHVILFNRKTEKIDFKEYIPTKDEEAAAMTAAQRYGDYDADVHVTIIKYIDDSDYEAIK